MANTIDWGQGAVNNTIDWGKGKTNNTINWGAIYDDTPAGETNIIGSGGVTPFVNTYSMSLDGVDEYFDLGTATNLQLVDDFSISVWIKDSSALNRGIICCGDRSSTSGWMLYRNSGMKAVFSLYTVNNKNAISTSSINTGTWTNIIATFEKNGTANQQIKIYINGTLEGQGGWLSTQTPTYAGTIYKQIGFPYAGTNEFEGLIDEASIYNRLLTSQEISEISATPIDLSSYNPLSWWRMGDGDTWNGSTWALTDNGTGGNNATSVNMEEADRLPISPNSYTQNSFSFDGVDENFTAGNPSSLQITGALTLSAWVKTSNNSQIQTIIGKDGVSTGTRSYLLNLATTGEARFFVFKSGSNTSVFSTTQINDGLWHHVLCVNDGADLKMYIDGTLENTTIGGGGTMLNGTSYFAIGRREANTPSNYNFFVGNIEEVSVFNSDQSSNISTIFNNGVPQDISSLSPISNWRMGESATWNGSIWTMTDQGSAGNNATSVNMEEADKTGDQAYVL